MSVTTILLDGLIAISPELRSQRVEAAFMEDVFLVTPIFAAVAGAILGVGKDLFRRTTSDPIRNVAPFVLALGITCVLAFIPYSLSSLTFDGLPSFEYNVLGVFLWWIMIGIGYILAVFLMPRVFPRA